MSNFDNVLKENIKERDQNWSQIPDHPYRILIIGGSGSGKTNSLFNLINQQPDHYKAKYQFLMNKRESRGLKDFSDSKAFI